MNNSSKGVCEQRMSAHTLCVYIPNTDPDSTLHSYTEKCGTPVHHCVNLSLREPAHRPTEYSGQV